MNKDQSFESLACQKASYYMPPGAEPDVVWAKARALAAEKGEPVAVHVHQHAVNGEKVGCNDRCRVVT